MWKYSNWLPVKEPRHIATLGEGTTPLVKSVHIGPSLGLTHLYFKIETQNPSGSYKDRFASVAVSLMIKEGQKKIVATSSGNTGSALAAYAARFGLEMELYLPEHCAQEKILQALAYGAKVLRVKGYGFSKEIEEHLLSRLQARAESTQAVFLMSAVCSNPREMEGVKTIAHEICEQMESGTDHVFIPVCAGGLFVTCGKGFEECFEAGLMSRLPCLHAVQPEGSATVAGPLSRGETRARAVTCTSEISGLQTCDVYDGQGAVEKVLLSGGTGQMVSDEEIYSWQRRMIREEGIYTEPAGAAATAGLARALQKGRIRADEKIVCLVTGSGFKDRKSIRQGLETLDLPLIDAKEI